MECSSSCIREIPITIEPKYDLQIVVPVFNVQRYLRRCISSIVSQKTRFSWPLFLVDDGSTDSSGLICDEYSSREENVLTVHKQNGGLSSARNAGMARIVSKYLMFVDADDCLLPGVIESLLTVAEQNDADIVQSQYRQLRFGVLSLRRYGPKIVGQITSAELLGYAWKKIYKSELFSRVCFPEGFVFEDTINRFLIFPQAKKYFATGNAGYAYRSNFKGITHSEKKSTKSMDTVAVTEEILRAHKILGLPEDKSYYESLERQRKTNINRLTYLPDNVRKNALEINDELFKSYL